MLYFLTFSQCFCSSAVPVTGKSSKDSGCMSFLSPPLFETFSTEAVEAGEIDDVGVPQGNIILTHVKSFMIHVYHISNW